MGIMSIVRMLVKVFKPADLIAFFACAFLGFFVSTILPAGPWAVFGSMLVFYHLFLTWLIIDADRKVGLSLPIALAIVTHLACLAVVITYGMGRDVVPFFGFLRYGIASIAVFERKWLFNESRKKEEKAPIAAPVSATAAATLATASADDYDAWVQHLATRNPLSRKPGMSVQDEYEQWLLARAKKRAAAS
jgi:hypothetical protein